MKTKIVLTVSPKVKIKAQRLAKQELRSMSNYFTRLIADEWRNRR